MTETKETALQRFVTAKAKPEVKEYFTARAKLAAAYSAGKPRPNRRKKQ